MNNKSKGASLKCLRAKTLQNQNQNETPLLKRSNTNRARINTLESISLKKILRKYTGDQIDIPICKSTLSPIKQYETKIKLSAQSWIMHDIKNNKYKRGWKHRKISNFNGLLRIIILFCYCKLIQENQDLKRLKVRVNQETLRQDNIKLSKKQQKRLSWLIKKKKFGLNNHTILNFYDILCGLILTDFQDLLDYSLIYCGFLIECEENDLAIPQKQNHHFIQSSQESQRYIQTFCNYCNFELFPNILKLQHTKFKSDFQLSSTCNDICSIFLSGLQNVQFSKIIQLRNIQFSIRYQVGLKFWERRTMSFSNRQKEQYDDYFCHLVCKGDKNYEAIAYNKKLKILMVIEDSKFSMADLDIKTLQNWFKTMTKPIVFQPQKQKIKSIFQSGPNKISPKKSIKFPLLSITDK